MKKILYLIISFWIISELAFGQTSHELLIKNTSEQIDSLKGNINPEKKALGFSIGSSRQLQLSGYTQIRYRIHDESKPDGFDLRRARLILKGDLTRNLSYYLQPLLEASPRLLDAYASIRFTDFLILTLGQTKIPFSMENLASENLMETIDRSQVVEALLARSKDVIGNHNARDLGIQASGSLCRFRDFNLFDYQIGIFNGSGIDLNDKNNYKDVIGRLVLHPYKNLSLGGSFYSGTAYFGTPVPSNQKRSRYGVEFNLNLHPFNLKGEYISGKDGIIQRNGWYAQSGLYIIPQKFQLVAKYDVYDPDTSIGNNITGNYTIESNFNFNKWSRLQASYTMQKQEALKTFYNFAIIQYQISF